MGKTFYPDTAMCNLCNDGFGCNFYKENPKGCEDCLKGEIEDCKKALKELKTYLKENKK